MPGTAGWWRRRYRARSRSRHRQLGRGARSVLRATISRGSRRRSRRRLAATSAAGRCSRPGRGARGRSSCSSWRCSTGSSSGAFLGVELRPRACSSARSSRSRTARRSTATGAGAARPAALPAYARPARAGGRRGVGRAAARVGGRLPSRAAGARRRAAGAGEPTRGDTVPSRRRRPPRQPRLARRRAEAGCRALRPSRARFPPRHPCADVLARGGSAGVAEGGRAAADHAVAVAGTARRRPVLAFGTPGGDQQDQWSFEFFLAHAVFGLDLQAAIDAPMFHSNHFPSSFFPRARFPGRWRSSPASMPRWWPRCASAATMSWSPTSGHSGACPRSRAGQRRPARRRKPPRDAGIRGGPLDGCGAAHEAGAAQRDEAGCRSPTAAGRRPRRPRPRRAGAADVADGLARRPRQVHQPEREALFEPDVLGAVGEHRHRGRPQQADHRRADDDQDAERHRRRRARAAART